MVRVIFSFIILFIFTGCIKEYPEYYKVKYILSTKITDFSKPTENLLLQMGDKLSYVTQKVKGKHIYVVDFVNIQNLETTSQLGLFLSSEIKKHVSYHFDLNVRELEYMQYFKLGVNGSKLLSRDNNEIIMDNLDKTYALVGTYAITQRQLILYLKLIDMKKGTILTTTSEKIELTDEIINLEKEKRRASQSYAPVVL